MKDLMNVKLFLKNNMSWCAAYNCSDSSKDNPEKPFLIPPKNECTRSAWKSMDEINQELSAIFNFLN